MSKFLDLDGLDYFWDKILARINAVVAVVNTKADITLVNTKADKAHTQLGQYNEADPGNDNLLMIGNGTDEDNPNTVFAVDSEGNVNADGSVFAIDEVSVLDTGGVTHNLTNKVDKAGDTMTGELTVIRGGSSSISIQDPGVTLSTAADNGVTANTYPGFKIADSNGQNFAVYEVGANTDGSVQGAIKVRNITTSGDLVENIIYMGVKKDGTQIYYTSMDRGWTVGLANFAWYMRRGRFVTVAAYGNRNNNMQKKLPLRSWVTLFTLPAGYRPLTYEVLFDATNYGNSDNICGQILTNGVVQVFASSSSNDPYWGFQVTFPVA